MNRTLIPLLLAGALWCCAGASGRQTIPTAKQIEDAAREVRAPFGGRYTDPAAVGSVARELLERLPRLPKPAEQYVCCTDAYDLARKAGDAATAVGAVEELDLRFAGVDALPMELAALAPLAQKPPPAEACATPLQQSAEAYLRALARDDAAGREAAEKLVPVMRALAARTTPPATAALVELLKEGNLIGRRRGPGLAAARRAAAAPDDAAAGEVAGRWLCFGARNWEEGLPCLGRGSDAELKRLALLEARAPDAKARLDLAKEWAALPTKMRLDALSAANARSHARELCGWAALSTVGATQEDALASRDRIGVLGGVGAAARAAGPGQPHHARITQLAFTPDGSRLVSVSSDGAMACWDAARAVAVAASPPNEQFKDASFLPMPDSRHVLVRYRRHCGLFPAADLTRELGRLNDFYPTELSGDGRTLLGLDGLGADTIATAVLDVPAGGPAGGRAGASAGKVTALHAAPAHVGAVLYTPDRTLIVAGFDDNGVRAYAAGKSDQSDKSVDRPLWTAAVTGRPRKLRVTPDGKNVWASGVAGCAVCRIDLRTGTTLDTFPPLEAEERNLPDLSPDTVWLLGWNAKDKKVELWDTAKGAAAGPVARFGGPNVTRVCWLPDSRRFLWAEGLTLHLWDAGRRQGRQGDVATFDTGQTSVAQTAVSPDGARAATGSAAGDVRFWPMPRTGPAQPPAPSQPAPR